MSADSCISVTVSYRGTSYPLALLPDSTLAALQVQLEELTSVPPSLQKLLYKGKKAGLGAEHEATLSEAGLKNGMKIQMLGSTTEELGSLQAIESEQKRRDRILRERALKAPTKVMHHLSNAVQRRSCIRSTQVRSTGSSNNASLKYRFHQLTPLPHLPDPASAHALLKKLSEDPAIKHIMRKHELSVGVLTELAPHEDPGLLGLNVNHGEMIKLRLRTDRYDGFRLYVEVRRVLCHELTHNVWGDHDNNVHILFVFLLL